MSMNFGREQALLRQRLTAKGSEELASARTTEFGDSVKFLGVEDAEIEAAAKELADTYPQMGRAQMTAFVRTLWGSKTHELRTVGVEILALRASLLEPPDLPFVEDLLNDTCIDGVSARIATDVLGPMVCKNKKLWKDLSRFAKSTSEHLKVAALLAAKTAIMTSGTVFDRFEKLVVPLLDDESPQVQTAIGEAIAKAVGESQDAVYAWCEEHGRPKPGPEKDDQNA